MRRKKRKGKRKDEKKMKVDENQKKRYEAEK